MSLVKAGGYYCLAPGDISKIVEQPDLHVFYKFKCFCALNAQTGAVPLLLIWQKMRHEKTDEQTAAEIVRIMLDHGVAVEVPNKVR